MADLLDGIPADRARRAARLAVIGGLSSFGPLSLDLYLPALPHVATSLHTSDGAAQLSVSGCLAGLAIGQFVFGPLGDRFGRRRPLLAGVSLWTVAALLCAVAPSVTALVILRLIQGLGGAAGLVLSRAVVRDLYDNTALARAFAVVALISNITPAVAPVAGGVLLHVMSWRGLFLVLTGAGAVLVAGTALFLPESLPAATARRAASGPPAAWSAAWSRTACSSGRSVRWCWPARCCSSTCRSARSSCSATTA